MAVSQKVLEVVLRAKDETAKAVKSAEKNIGGIGVGALAGGALAAGATAALAVGAGLNSAADDAAKYGSQIVAIQRMTGATAADSSKLAAIFARLGIDASGGGRMIKTLDTAIAGNSKTLRDAGIATKDATGHNRSSIDVMRDLARYYSTATDKTKATAVASSLLGKNWQTMLPVLAGGAKTIDKISDAAKRNGQVMSQEQLSTVTKSAAAWKDLEAQEKGVTTQVGLAVLPFRTLIAQGLMKVIDWVKVNGPKVVKFFKDFGNNDVLMAIVAPVLLIFKHWKPIAAFFQKLWKDIKPFWDQFVAALKNALTPAVKNLQDAWAALWPQLKPLIPYFKEFAKYAGGALLIVILLVVGAVLAFVLGIAKLIEGITWVIKKIAEGTKAFSDFFTTVSSGFKTWASNVLGPIGDVANALANLNPFQRHSPSLVDNVLAGVGVIKGAYGSLGKLSVPAPQYAFAGGSTRLSGASAGIATVPAHTHDIYLDGKLVSRTLGTRVTSTARSGGR